MLKKIIRDFILYSFSFLISFYIHKGTFLLSGEYDLYYAAFMISWGLSALLARKYKKLKREFLLLNKLYNYIVSFFLMLGTLAFIIYKFNLTEVSRFIILNSLLISFSIEIGYLLYKNREKINFKRINLIYSIKAFTFEVLLFGIINLYLIYKLAGNISFNSWNLLLFLIFYLSWFVGSFLGHQFHPRHRKKDYWAFIWQYLKSYIIILALILFAAFVNRLSVFNIMILIYGVVFYSILSFIGISVYYNIKKHRILALNIAGFPVKGESGDILLDEKIPDMNNYYRSSFNTNDSEFLNSKFKNFSLKKYPEVYEFLDKSIDLSSFNYFYSEILNSVNVSDVDLFRNGSLQLLLNLRRINLSENINEYLRIVNNKLMKDAIFAGNFKTVYLRHQRFLKRYPYYFAQLFYFFDFLWNRVGSKLIILNKIYSGLTRNNYKALSLAEGLGRLYFSGFEVLHLKIINDRMYFIAKKTKEPLQNITPSTGLIFKMNRIGKNGKRITVYKIRTMHPYAEYIQEFIYEKFNFQDGGKFKHDFRITYWGGILRKLFLDELPMLYNWLKGDLKLVGFRPLSLHYFNLYKEELKLKRLKCKPGLIPPFYVDIPKTFNEIMESEERYIAAYEKNPIITDIKYFIQCFYNILFKGVRSS